MYVCVAVVNIIRMVLDILVAIVEWVIQTVCNWVSSILEFAEEVCEKVCGWLGPFSFLCDWVCEVVRWTETVWDWVCEEVLVGVIVGFMHTLIEVINYVLTWVCWLIEWIPRGIDLLLCKGGFKNRRWVHFCIKVLERDAANPVWTHARVDQLIVETEARLRQCNVSVCVTGFETIETEKHLSVDCGAGLLVDADFYWYKRKECRGVGAIQPVTLFFIEELDGEKGCSIPGSNFMLVDPAASNATIAHELGHLCDLWVHSSDPANVMYSPSSNASVEFSGSQCCLIRSSRFVTTASHVCAGDRM